jgi:predicted aspartyl protease
MIQGLRIAILAILTIGVATAMSAIPAHSAQTDQPKKAAAKLVPFKLAKPDKPLILLETMVNGKGPFRFVLDTGAGVTIISPGLAKKLNIKPHKRKKPDKATGAGGTMQIQFGTVKSLKVGEARLERLKVGIMDLSGIGKAIETEIDGIIGYNFLKKFRVTIDYPKQTVTFE